MPFGSSHATPLRTWRGRSLRGRWRERNVLARPWSGLRPTSRFCIEQAERHQRFRRIQVVECREQRRLAGLVLADKASDISGLNGTESTMFRNIRTWNDFNSIPTRSSPDCTQNQARYHGGSNGRSPLIEATAPRPGGRAPRAVTRRGGSPCHLTRSSDARSRRLRHCSASLT